uniref:Odorant receptor n=1 Tax=Chrysomela lapponica TaxID=153811 RepID=A0A310S9J6_CHRLA
MEDDGLLDLRDIVRINIDVLYFFGNMYPRFRTSVVKLFYIARLSIFFGFFFMGIVSAELANWYASMGNLQAMVNASFLTLSNMVSMIKFYAIFRHQDRIFALLESTNRKEFRPKNRQQRSILRHFIRTMRTISLLMYGGCLFTCAFWAISPFTDEDGPYLPIAAWVPFEPSKGTIYFEIVFAYEILATIVGGITDMSADCLIAGFLIVVCAQLKILNNSLSNIRQLSLQEERSGLLVHDSDDDSNEPEIMWMKLQAVMDDKLVECVVHHRCVLEFAEELTSLFSYSILGQFVVSVIIICTTLFEITMVSFMSVKFFSLILYQYCMLMEIFILCYFGNEVILESNKLTNSAYHCNWRPCSMHFKENLLFFMTRSQRVLKLYAGGFFTLSLDTFVRILKSSWSYFAVLIQVNKRKLDLYEISQGA